MVEMNDRGQLGPVKMISSLSGDTIQGLENCLGVGGAGKIYQPVNCKWPGMLRRRDVLSRVWLKSRSRIWGGRDDVDRHHQPHLSLVPAGVSPLPCEEAPDRNI